MNKKCGDCYHFHNLPDIPYNQIHENFKKCDKGNIVSENCNACDNYEKLIQKINLKENSQNQKKRRKIKFNFFI